MSGIDDVLLDDEYREDRDVHGDTLDYESIPDDLDLDVADELLRELFRLQSASKRVTEQFNRRIETVTDRRDVRVAELDRRAEAIRAHLERWLRERHAAGGSLSLRLPSGDMSLSQATPEVTVVDEELAIASLEAAGVDGEAVSRKVSVSIGGLRKVLARNDKGAEPGAALPAVTTDGVVVEGVVVKARERRASIKGVK